MLRVRPLPVSVPERMACRPAAAWPCRQARLTGVLQHDRPGAPRRRRHLRHPRDAGRAFQQPGDAGALVGVHDLGTDERLRARPHPACFHRYLHPQPRLPISAYTQAEDRHHGPFGILDAFYPNEPWVRVSRPSPPYPVSTAAATSVFG
jgi:hypothetical protein